MKIIVTCGPSYEPIDGARRMTNMSSAKFATRDGRLHLILAPAMKVLPRMRDWFPDARIVGWKYELAGTRDDAFGKAWKQLRDGQTDACVLNGAAYGDGFAICHAGGRVKKCSDTPALCEILLEWLRFPAPAPAALPAGVPA